MGGGVGEGVKRRYLVGRKPKTIPFPLFFTPSLSAARLGSGEESVLVGVGDVKATDFLTSLAALAPSLRPLHLRSQGQGWGGEGLGGVEGALPSPLVKFRLPLPLSWLRERPEDSKNERE